jgi:hypothetical protein
VGGDSSADWFAFDFSNAMYSVTGVKQKVTNYTLESFEFM